LEAVLYIGLIMFYVMYTNCQVCSACALSWFICITGSHWVFTKPAGHRSQQTSAVSVIIHSLFTLNVLHYTVSQKSSHL